MAKVRPLRSARVPPRALPSRPPRVSAEEAREIAIEAYLYAFPMVLCELTRRSALARPGASPNRFHHLRAFPDPTFTEAVRPNADTLYSRLWFDVQEGPLLITVPGSEGRYYVLQMMDLWSDVFAAPGSRTTGTDARRIVLADQRWRGDLPEGALVIRSPTATGRIVARTQTNGVSDYEGVHAFQDRLVASPVSHSRWRRAAPRVRRLAARADGLSRVRHREAAPSAAGDPSWDPSAPPVEQIQRLAPQAYFGLFASLVERNPPHANDYPMLHRLARIGVEPGRPYSVEAAPPEVRHAIDAAAAPALAQIRAGLSTSGVTQNGWRTNLSLVGSYGTAYLQRAVVAFGGLGANLVEDAVYPSAFTDSDLRRLSAEHRYVLHFPVGHLPPVRAFWSLTMYDERQLFAPNAIGRYAVGDRDPLRYNSDGTLDLFIQRDSPGEAKAPNWLPTPARGAFTLTLRLYWPKPEVLRGAWAPPPLRRVT